MKAYRINFIAICSLVLVCLLGGPNTSTAQAVYHAKTLSLAVTGTSSLHDWEMTSDKGKVDAMIAVANDKVNFSKLSFIVPAESLKSGHGMMDKNTYKAIGTKKNPNISFELVSGNVTPTGNNTYQFKGIGNMTIAGNTKKTDLVATLKYNPADKSFTCMGVKKFKMSEYGVKPPTVMMGTIKTGDAIAITYNLTIKN